MGIPHDSPQPVKAGLQFALSEASEDGHCYLPEGELITKAVELLGVDGQAVGGAERTAAGHRAGPRRRVVGVALSADGRLLASDSIDGTVRLWEAGSGACLRVPRADRRYERLDITGPTGVTVAQRSALLALGAVDSST